MGVSRPPLKPPSTSPPLRGDEVSISGGALTRHRDGRFATPPETPLDLAPAPRRRCLYRRGAAHPRDGRFATPPLNPPLARRRATRAAKLCRRASYITVPP